MSEALVPQEVIENKIYLLRGQKVMLDMDLAGLYRVPTKQLNRQVRRNIERFPIDFMFQLTKEEWEALRLQIATLNEAPGNKILRCQIGTLKDVENGKILKFQNGTSSLRFQIGTLKQGQHLKYLPYAFTEHGILMLSSILNSPRAIDVNIHIMRTFSRLRQLIANNKELSAKLELIEKRVLKHDGDIRELIRYIRRLSLPKQQADKKIGFLK